MSPAHDQPQPRVTNFDWASDDDPSRPRHQCQVCGRAPARRIELKWQIGMVLARVTQHRAGTFCRDHAVSEARKNLLRTSLLGWWGVISFFTNFVAVGEAIAAIRKAKTIDAPAGPISPIS